MINASGEKIFRYGIESVLSYTIEFLSYVLNCAAMLVFLHVPGA